MFYLDGKVVKKHSISTAKNGNKVARVTVSAYLNGRQEFYFLRGFNEVAERLVDQLEKGDRVNFRGKLTPTNFKDRKGLTQYQLQLMIYEFTIIERAYKEDSENDVDLYEKYKATPEEYPDLVFC